MRRLSSFKIVAEASHPAAENQQTDNAWRALASVVDLVKNVEAKAAVTLGSSTAIGGLLLSIARGHSLEQTSLALPVCVGAVSSVAAGVSSAMTLWPRLYTKDCVRSELFFGHMDQKFGTPREFVDQACGLLSDKDRLIREVIGQFWSISCIARRKYRWSKTALAFALAALANLAIAATVVSL